MKGDRDSAHREGEGPQDFVYTLDERLIRLVHLLGQEAAQDWVDHQEVQDEGERE